LILDNNLNSKSSVEESGAISSLTDEYDHDLTDLKEKHRLLKAKLEEKQRKEQELQTLVEQSAQRRIEIEIRPKFIVPDTNCFIDHLNLIEQLLNTNYYTIVVPLLVVNEIDKLSKSLTNMDEDEYDDDSLEHVEYVRRNARKAMQFLNVKFEKKERFLRAMTAQGALLDTIKFKSEELTKRVINYVF
jgi:protein SMG6